MDAGEAHGQFSSEYVGEQLVRGSTVIQHIHSVKRVVINAGSPTTVGGGTDFNGNDDVTAVSLKEFRLLIVGKTGSGKSSTGNSILGQKKFDVSFSATSVTVECSKESKILDDGRVVEIVDTPGLFDNKMTPEEVAAIILRAVAGMHPGPHAVLYVIPLGVRYTEEEYHAYQRLKVYLGEEITRFMQVVFTRGDELDEQGQTIEKYLKTIPEQLKVVLRECANRYLVFDNKKGDNEAQVASLLGSVESMLNESDDPHYKSSLTELVGEKLEQEISKRVKEADEKVLENNKCFQAVRRQNKNLVKTCVGLGCGTGLLCLGAAVGTPILAGKVAAGTAAAMAAKATGWKAVCVAHGSVQTVATTATAGVGSVAFPIIGYKAAKTENARAQPDPF